MRRQILVTVRDAAVAVALAAGAALAFNALRPAGIPLVARHPYRILVPCPEQVGEAAPVQPGEVRWGDPAEVVVDAREPGDFAAWHAPAARSLPYDYLEPVDPAAVADLAGARGERVVVYGDGMRPDSGEHLARELSGGGVRNVHFVPGGAQAVRRLLDPDFRDGPAGGNAP